MKLFLALLLIATASAEPIKTLEKLTLATGRTYSKVTVIDASSEGLQLKYSRGTEWVKFSELGSNAAAELGAFDPAKVDPKTSSPEERNMARILAENVAKDAAETNADFKKRQSARVAQMRRLANDWWLKLAKANEAASERAKEGYSTLAADDAASQAWSFAIACEFAGLQAAADAK